MPIPNRVKNNPNLDLSVSVSATLPFVINEIVDATEVEINSALTTINQDIIWEEEETESIPEVWDQLSDINGIPAQQVLAERDDIVPGSDIVLVRNSSGDVVIFQPHAPESEGLVSITDGNVTGRAMADEMISARVSSRVKLEVLNQIKAARAKP